MTGPVTTFRLLDARVGWDPRPGDGLAGVSLDGGAEANDRHRRYANGAGSHARVDVALRRLGDRPGALTGLLCTVDLRNDPAEVFDSLAAYRPPVIDFLLPHGNWDAPPPGRPPDATTPYGDWLVAAFEHWSTRRSDAPEHPHANHCRKARCECRCDSN